MPGEWSLSDLSFGRLPIDDARAQIDKLETALRVKEKVKREQSLSRLGGERVMEFENHRPFWNEEWDLDPTERIRWIIRNSYEQGIYEDLRRVYAERRGRRRYRTCTWNDSTASRHDGRLQISTTLSQAKYLLHDQEDSTHWNCHLRFDLSQAPTADLTACQLMRGVCSTWHLDPFLTMDTDSPTGFRLAMPAESQVRARHRVLLGETDFPFPVSLTLKTSADSPEALSLFDATLNYVRQYRGDPTLVQFQFEVDSTKARQYVEVCRAVRPLWDNWSFLGRYKRGFDPYARPRSMDHDDVRIYPVLEYSSMKTGSVLASELFVRASVIHGKDESFIELQTSEGSAWLETAAKYAGSRVDAWDGPMEERWGLYSRLFMNPPNDPA